MSDMVSVLKLRAIAPIYTGSSAVAAIGRSWD
jgi:hypothetical protein